MLLKTPFSNLSEKEDGSKITQIMAVLTASIALIISGIHIGWPGPSIPKILSPEYPFNVTTEEASYVAIIGPVGDIIGGILSASIVDIIGRKKTILCLFIPQCFNFLMLATAIYVKELLYFGRLFGGIAEGAAITVLPVYIAEVAEPEVRGILGTCISMTFVIGKLFMNVLGSYVTIQTAAYICLIFSFVFVLTFIHMPETPYFLLMKNRKEDAEHSLKILRRKQNVKKEVMELSSDISRQMSESGRYKDLFTIKSNRKAFLLVVGVVVFQQMTGCTAFSMYIQIILKEGTNLSPVLGSSIVILVQLAANILSAFIIDKFGRKPLFITSAILCCINLSSLTIFFSLRDYARVDVSQIAWLPFLILLIYMLVFQIGLGVVTNVFVSEIYSTSIKSKALSVGSIVFSSFMILTTKFYQFTAETFGMAVPLGCFAICTAFGALFFMFVLPETKGRTLEEIQQELKGNKRDGKVWK